MKGSRVYILCIIVFVGILFLIEGTLPKKFVWTPTFSHRDHQPFGCAVFDDVLSASMPNGYRVEAQTLYQLAQDSAHTLNVLVVDDRLSLSQTDFEALYTLLHRGSKFVMVASDFDHLLRDTLGFKLSYAFFDLKQLKAHVMESARRDTILYLPDAMYHSLQEYPVYPHLLLGRFSEYDSLSACVVAGPGRDVYSRAPYARSWQIGKGELTLVTTPLLFTNYGMLDGNTHHYIFRIINRLKGRQVVRLESYQKSLYMSQEQQTPLRYILSQPPLRWGLYATMLLILLFMIFTARRRQRAIPVIKKPINRSLEFVKLIGTLYYQRKDHSDLLIKKYIYFADTLRREIQVDTDSGEPDEELARRIAIKTGVDETRVAKLLYALRRVEKDGLRIDNRQLTHLVDEMNEIIKQI